MYTCSCNCYFFHFQKKTKINPSFSLGKKTQKLCHNCPTIYLFSWEREGNPYTSNPIKNFKILQSALSDQPLQCTSLDLQCVCDEPQNCPILQNFMYILHEFCTFPVTEGNEILHLYFISQLQAENSSKNP